MGVTLRFTKGCDCWSGW